MGIDYVSVVNTSVNVSFIIAVVSVVQRLSLPAGVVGVMGVGHTSVAVLPIFLILLGSRLRSRQYIRADIIIEYV